MAEPSRIELAEAAPPDEANERVRELLRRIEEIETLGESAFGRFTRWDWIACVLLTLALPTAALLWFGR